MKKSLYSSRIPSEVKLPAHRAGLPGRERTKHECAPQYLRKGVFTLTSVLSDPPPKGEEDYGIGSFTGAPGQHAESLHDGPFTGSKKGLTNS